jgi:hypothetical protein
MRIKSTMLKRGLQFYRLAKDKFIGTMLEGGQHDIAPTGKSSLLADGTGSWIDAAGMFMPRATMGVILDMVENGLLSTVDEIVHEFEAAYGNYKAYAYNWALDVLTKELDRKPSAEDIDYAVEKGRAAAVRLEQITDDDARKERGPLFALSYGLDAESEEARLADYKTVRGIE